MNTNWLMVMFTQSSSEFHLLLTTGMQYNRDAVHQITTQLD